MLKSIMGIIALFLIFLSGAVPYTLIYKESSLQSLGIEDPIEVTDAECTTDKKVYNYGERMRFDFSTTLTNHTDRFLMVSAKGDIYPPKQPVIFRQQSLLLTPGEKQSVHFYVTTFFEHKGEYKCEVNYRVGWMNF